jgi:hypothetical protein
MNTQQSTVNYFLESEWVEVIEEHICRHTPQPWHWLSSLRF